MAINQDWKIRTRTRNCAHSEQEFADGEPIYTALFENPETGEFTRSDYSVAAWEEVADTLEAFSYWKSQYEAPVEKTTAKNVVQKANAESLLRRLIEEDEASTENARYILALMLERKRTLVQTDRRVTENSVLLIYEHDVSGEVFIIRDPQLKLSEVEHVQDEVAVLLGGKARPKEEEIEVEHEEKENEDEDKH